MRRFLLDFFATALLLSTVMITIGGFRSISRADALVFHGPNGQPAALVTSRGVLYFAICDVPVWSVQQVPVDYRRFPTQELLDYRDTMVLNASQQFGYQIIPASSVTMSAASVERVWAGFSIGKGTDALNVPGKWFAFASAPVWAVVPVLLIMPVRRIASRLTQRRRAKRGQCPTCGYDLRESSGRCPECGAVQQRVI